MIQVFKIDIVSFLLLSNSIVPIKSVHITNYYHKNSGGISTSYNNLLKAANRHQRPIRLIVPGEKSEVENVGEYGKIHYVPARYSPIFDKRYRVMMPWQYMFDRGAISRILLAEKPDFIEVTDKYMLSILGAVVRTNNFKLLGRPMLVHFSAERMDDNIASFLSGGKSGKSLARFLIGNYTLPNFDFHLANSAYTAQEFFDAADAEKNAGRNVKLFNTLWRYFKAPRVPIEERVFVCPRGVDSDFFTPERKSDQIKKEMRAAANIPENAKILLYAGRISPEKNVELLLDTTEILAKDEKNDYRLLVAGAGPKADWLKEESAKHFPNKIILLGHLDKEKLADYYANADVFVHPNPKEPFGIAPLEAMASGVPVVAPNAGGVLTYATDENIWLRAPTGADFAAAVQGIIENPAQTKAKIENALATARANTWEKSTERLLATYDKIYADFQNRKELFTDRDAARKFDFAKLVS